MKYIAILILMVGCIPMNKTKQQTSTVVTGLETQGEILESQPLVTGDNNKVLVMGGLEQVSRNISAKSNASMESTYSLTTQVSIGFNILMFGIGGLMIRSLVKGSKTMTLTMGLLDSGIASAVAMASSSTDPKDIAAANHLKAELANITRHL